MSKPGSGGVASAEAAHIARRERLRALAVETADLSHDPYLLRNHLGSYECRLCMTLHTNEGSYLAHTQAKKHQQNLARRAAKLRADSAAALQPQLGGAAEGAGGTAAESARRRRLAQGRAAQGRAGTPGYRIVKQFDPTTGRLSLLFSLSYPQVSAGVQPRHRFMSTFEQQREVRDAHHQYVVVAAEPYQVVAFKVPNQDIERGEGGVVSHWNEAQRTFTLHITFKPQPQHQHAAQLQLQHKAEERGGGGEGGEDDAGGTGERQQVHVAEQEDVDEWG